MKMRFLLLLFVILVPEVFYSQNFTNDWEGHFSYLDIKDISKGEAKIYAAAENAIFIYDTQTQETQKISTIHGLSGETISSIKYVEENGILLVGFENGLMQVYIESTSEFKTVVDILNKPAIPPNNKKINHFMIYDGFAYISTDYGISLYDINALEFGDTYYIGPGGSQILVNQTTVFNEFIYVATTTGIRKALVDSPNLVDFQQWNQVVGLNWVGIDTVEDKLYALATNKRLYEIVNDAIVQKIIYQYTPIEIRSENNSLLITTQKELYAYDVNLNEIVTTQMVEDFDTEFTAATISTDDDIFIGTKGNPNTGRFGFGVLKSNFENPIEFEEIHPDCPISNSTFAIAAADKNLWVTYGDYTVSYNPFPLKKSGFSHLKNEEWINIPFESVFGVINLNKININPYDLNKVYINSFGHGMIQVENDEPTVLYSLDNSSFQSSHPTITDIRVSASKIDANGILWCTNSRIFSPLKSYNVTTGEWKSYDFSDIIINPTSTEIGFGDLDIDQNGVKWIGGHRLGIIGYDNSGATPLLKYIAEEEHNMPSPSVKTVTVDRSNNVWFGMDKGLRVIFNNDDFFSNPNFEPSEIIVLDDGTPRELLYQQYLTDIEVDGSNNKWIATLGTGVYYFSSDGQKTIYHFTKDNSPLPTNDVLDIALDETNGIVYMATSKGLVSFRSETSKPQETLQDAYVYPNPVRPTFNITNEKVKIKGLTENVNIKITDIEGNLVTEATSRTNSKFKGYNLEVDGGTALWNGKNISGRIVASGVYLIMLSDLDSLETKVLKVMVVR